MLFNKEITMTRTTPVVLATLATILGVSTSLPAQTVEPVYSGAVQDCVVIDHPSWFQGPANDGFGLPFPPLHTIPPIEMPTPDATAIERLMTGDVLIHDASTGTTIEVPGLLPDGSSSGSVKGFRGLDGGGEGMTVAAAGECSQILSHQLQTQAFTLGA